MQFDQARFAAVVAAKAKAANSPKWTRAIDRAAEALQSGELVVSLLHVGALVTSPRGSNFVNGHCECEAARRGHRECKDRAAVRLVEMMEMETARPAAPARADIIADIKAAWSRRKQQSRASRCCRDARLLQRVPVRLRFLSLSAAMIVLPAASCAHLRVILSRTQASRHKTRAKYFSAACKFSSRVRTYVWVNGVVGLEAGVRASPFNF